MDDPNHPAGLPAKRKWTWWLDGRAGRAEYFAYIGLIFVLAIALSFVPNGPSGSWATGVILFGQVRRLHDFGRTGWWAILATFSPLALLALIPVLQLELVMGLMVIATLIPIIAIGVIRSDPGENRFGPPAPFTWKRTFTGR